MVPTARIFTLTSRSGVWPEVLPLWYKFWSSSARWVSQFWLVFPWSGVFGVFLGATLPLWFLHQSHPSNSSLFQLSRVTHPLGLGPSGRNFLRSPIWFCPSFFRLLFSFFFSMFCSFFLDTMAFDQPKTIVIHAHGLVAAKSSNILIQMLSKNLDCKKVRSIQFIPSGCIRVTFSCLEYRNIILNCRTPQIDHVHNLNITKSDMGYKCLHTLSSGRGGWYLHLSCSLPIWDSSWSHSPTFCWLQRHHWYAYCANVSSATYPIPVQHSGLCMLCVVFRPTSEMHYLQGRA